MKYVIAASASDIAPGAMKSVSVDGNQLLVANVGGDYYAITQKCPHMGANLCDGQLNANIVTCPKHKAGFDVMTGAPVDPAKVLFLKMKTKPAKSFSVKVEDGKILIGV